MNEALIKKIIQCKLELCDVVMDQLPPKISSEARKIEKVILESICDYIKADTEHKTADNKSTGNQSKDQKAGLQTISIE